MLFSFVSGTRLRKYLTRCKGFTKTVYLYTVYSKTLIEFSGGGWGGAPSLQVWYSTGALGAGVDTRVPNQAGTRTHPLTPLGALVAITSTRRGCVYTHHPPHARGSTWCLLSSGIHWARVICVRGKFVLIKQSPHTSWNICGSCRYTRASMKLTPPYYDVR